MDEYFKDNIRQMYLTIIRQSIIKFGKLHETKKKKEKKLFKFCDTVENNFISTSDIVHVKIRALFAFGYLN